MSGHGAAKAIGSAVVEVGRGPGHMAFGEFNPQRDNSAGCLSPQWVQTMAKTGQ